MLKNILTFIITFSEEAMQHQDNLLLLSVMLVWLLVSFIISKKYQALKKAFIITSVCYTFLYIIWRTIFTLPLHSGVLSMIFGCFLLGAEILGTWSSTVFQFLFWKPYRVPKKTIDSLKVLPSVDVLVPSFNEPLELVKKTLIACKSLQYPPELLNVYLCDDGNREDARIMCLENNIGYLTREKHENAKAGNLNHALKLCHGEVFAIFDADMVPNPDFLEKCIGYFADEKVAFVQVPQVFYNPDPFQFNLKFGNRIPNEQDFFMREVQMGRARFNAVLHVGTNALFRRSAVDDIGGIPTGSITEDMATGMLLQAKQYQCVFVNEELAAGLSVESFSDLLRQRERWCRGNIQVSKKWNIFLLKGLSLPQRIIYFDGLLYWFFGIQKMIYILSPLLFLLFGILIMNITFFDLILFWFPSFLGSLLSFHALASKNRSLTWSHIYEVAMAPYLGAVSILELLGVKNLKFRVTPKAKADTKRHFSFWAAFPHIFLLMATLIGWWRSFELLQSGYLSPTTSGSILINIAWSVYNAFAIAMSIYICMERPRFRKSERTVCNLPVHIFTSEFLDPSTGLLKDISENGMRVSSHSLFFHRGQEITVKIADMISIRSQVVRARYSNGLVDLGIRFQALPSQTYRQLVQYIATQLGGYYSFQNK